MNVISAVTGLFGSSKSMDKTLEIAATGISNGLDKIWYTDEEKADRVEAGKNLFMKFASLTMDQNSIRSITRRWLAFIVVAPVMITYFTGTIFVAASAFNIAEPLLDVKGAVIIVANHWLIAGQALLTSAWNMMPYAGGILVFYFGPHLLGALKGKQKEG